MPDSDPETLVIFRKWRSSLVLGDGIIALFPYDPADDYGLMCGSYEHIGQHAAASPGLVIGRTRPATEAEYAALKRELESPPFRYRLKVVQRTPPDAASRRREALRRSQP